MLLGHDFGTDERNVTADHSAFDVTALSRMAAKMQMEGFSGINGLFSGTLVILPIRRLNGCSYSEAE